MTATATGAPAPKLATMKYQVVSIVSTDDRVTVMEVMDRSVGGGRYALKVLKRELPADDLEIERAKAECAASAKLGHPAILKAHDCRLRKSWFRVSRAELLSEFADGKRFADLKRIPVGAAVFAYHEVAAALAHMHRRGVIHGDLHPWRIHVTRSCQVKVRGYGLNGLPPAFKTQYVADKTFGAPEQIREKTIEEPIDIYALGACLFVALTGKSPKRAEDSRLPNPQSVNPKIPGPLNDLVVSCMQPHPSKRPPDMYEVVTRLEAVKNEMKVDAESLQGLAAGEE